MAETKTQVAFPAHRHAEGCPQTSDFKDNADSPHHKPGAPDRVETYHMEAPTGESILVRHCLDCGATIHERGV